MNDVITNQPFDCAGIVNQISRMIFKIIDKRLMIYFAGFSGFRRFHFTTYELFDSLSAGINFTSTKTKLISQAQGGICR